MKLHLRFEATSNSFRVKDMLAHHLQYTNLSSFLRYPRGKCKGEMLNPTPHGEDKTIKVIRHLMNARNLSK